MFAVTIWLSLIKIAHGGTGQPLASDESGTNWRKQDVPENQGCNDDYRNP